LKEKRYVDGSRDDGIAESTTLVIEIEFLGTGTSTGVPVIGCDCEVCRSDDPRDTRLRTSALIRIDNVTLLIDTSPDLRYQMLRSGNHRVDALLYTHAHADHTAGIDEMRRFNALQQEWIPTFAPPNAAEDLRQRFGYAFEDMFPIFGMKPDLDLKVIDGATPFDVAGVTVCPIPVAHGTLPVVGYRVGNVAYLTDVKRIPDESLALLQDLDILVLTALRRFNHPAHMTLDEALEMVETLRPKRTYLTHVAHEMGLYRDISEMLPDNVELATDGLIVRGSDAE
jgi:phosphoribosyl 1,2-cyclic phosphate phosphodiesterase